MQDPTNVVDLISGRAGRGRGGYKPLLIVLHIQEGLGRLEGYFSTVDADSTMQVMRDGTLVRMLYDSDDAWTNGLWTEPINHANPLIQQAYTATAANGDNSNSVSLTIESEGYPGVEITAAQYASLAKMCAYWCGKYGWQPTRQRIVGHYEVGEHKQCPGKAVNIDKVVQMTQDLMNGGNSNSSSQPNIPPGMVALDNPNKLDIYDDAFKDPVTGFQVIQPFCVYYRDNGGLDKFGHPTSGLYGAVPGGQDQDFEWAHFYFDKPTGKVMAKLIDRNNPKGFSIGPGVMDVLRSEGLTAVSAEQYFTANSGQVLGQRSFTYAQDAAGVTYQVEAVEDIDGNGKKIGTWTKQIYKFIKEIK